VLREYQSSSNLKRIEWSFISLGSMCRSFMRGVCQEHFSHRCKNKVKIDVEAVGCKRGGRTHKT
jgi:hypothetical protein